MENKKETCEICGCGISEGKYIFENMCKNCFIKHLHEHLALTAIGMGLHVYINTYKGKIDITGEERK